MPSLDPWQLRAKRLLRAELAARGVSYRELTTRLAAIGVEESERNVANRIARGSFSAAFLLQCLTAIGCTRLSLEGPG